MQKKHSEDPDLLIAQAFCHLNSGGVSIADRLMNRALKLQPDTERVLLAQAILFEKTGREPQAEEFFRRAIAVRPSDTLTYYSLALVQQKMNHLDECLATLEQLFAKAAGSEGGPELTVELALVLYEDVQQALAEKNHEAASIAVQDFCSSVEALIDSPIVTLVEEMAEDRVVGTEVRDGKRVIRVNSSMPLPLRPYLFAQELMCLEVMAESRKAGASRMFMLNHIPNAACLRLLHPEDSSIHGRQHQRRNPTSSDRSAWESMRELLGVLHRCPLDLIAETRLCTRLPILGPAQFLGMALFLSHHPDPDEYLHQEHGMPPVLVRARLALESVSSILHNDLFHKSSGDHWLRAQTEIYPLVVKLWECWKSKADSLVPGDENRLVDKFADVLGLQGCYEWAPVRLSAG